MPCFEPFPALRYATDQLDSLVAPPYDVLSAAEVAELASRSEYNIVHVDVPAGGEDRYRRAAALLHDWVAAAVLVPDDSPSYTIYRLNFTDVMGRVRRIVGVMGGLEVVDEGAGGVLPHERTTAKASTDRLDLTRTTATNLSPVWGLSLAGGLTELLAEPGEVVGRVADDGVEHIVERVSDPARMTSIRTLLAGDDVLIADGHHRYGVARIYRDEVRTATGRTDTGAEQTLAFVSELVADQLSVEAIHRLYAGISLDELTTALDRCFDRTACQEQLSSATLAQMTEHGFLVLVGPDGASKLTPKPGIFDDLRPLDGAWLERALASSTAQVNYQHGLEPVIRCVAEGAATAGVLIRPVSVAEIERTARQGELMPPKSTFFTPKLKTGFVLRPAS